ncbi:rhomboid family intramembrane serine protease [Streptomyces orinoci]|uniref:Rhomboid family intramembrane serine protease n=1 Tax=Streptomyces orinoci TaxID=67339 RepID=A0ABV3K7G7_STRON|nr:rhomboid family intramembrane serine protease [Streptomyces orinoci]
MNAHVITLYAGAVAVIGPGMQIIAARTTGRRTAPPQLLAALWRRPVPWAAAGLLAVMVVMALVQTAVPGVMGHLERTPDGPWWRAVTALLVQTSGWTQLTFNLAALVGIAPAAERLLGPVLMPVVFLLSGIAAHAVSMAGWSVHGGGDSVGLCGLVGALACAYALTGERAGLRWTALLVPVAGALLCVLRNNHGIGLLAGSVLGAALTLGSATVRTRARCAP